MADVICSWCEEEEGATMTQPCIRRGDDGQPVAGTDTWHPECWRRQLIGSVGHQMRLCWCFGGSWQRPDWLSVREEAVLSSRVADTLAELDIGRGRPGKQV